MLQFAVGTDIGVSAAAQLTTAFQVGIAKGNVHIDVLAEGKTSVSNWTPTCMSSLSIPIPAIHDLY